MVQANPLSISAHHKYIEDGEDDIPIQATILYRDRITPEGLLPWTEYRGESGPRSDVGRTGDVWMKTKLNSMALYWNVMGKWISWSGLDRDERGQWILTPNPIIPTLYLWVGTKGAVWISRTAIILKISRKYHPLSLPVNGSTFVYNFLKPLADCREGVSVYECPSPLNVYEQSLVDQRDKKVLLMENAKLKKNLREIRRVRNRLVVKSE